MSERTCVLLTTEGVDALIAALRRQGRSVIGPAIRDGAIGYHPIAGVADLPIGWGDEQAPGRYRLRRRDDGALFGYNLGADSPKRHLHAPEQRLWRAVRGRDGGLRAELDEAVGEPLAFIGVRACELAAMDRQERVLAGGEFVDPHYAARRRDVFVVAVNCTQAAASCFCTSMGTGPQVRAGYDIALTELIDGEGHRLLAEAGSDRGAALLESLPGVPAGDAERARAQAAVRATAREVGRRIEREGLHDDLLASLEHPRWDDVAERCLACGNCTMVCPTCFCTATEERGGGLDPDTAERWRRWDSCFNVAFSQLHGGAVRRSVRARYRQWLTHKLATWEDQFGDSGCVGCGRCITWCPVGIDITEEVAAIRRPPPGADDG